MKIVVLPFNAAAGTRPAIARQFAQFASEIARRETGEEVDAINYMAQYQDEGVMRVALVNPSEALNEADQLSQFFSQSETQNAVDGLVTETEEGTGEVTYRFFKDGNPEPVEVKSVSFTPATVFDAMRQIIRDTCEFAGGKLDSKFDSNEELFGTENGEAFMLFLEGYDAAQYIERANGNVAREFNPDFALDKLVNACNLDKDWEGPMLAALQLTRLCTSYRIGTADMIDGGLRKLLEAHPEEPRIWFSLGDLHQNVGDNAGAADAFERAAKFEPEEPAILTRLAICQMNMGMPANAERNLRKALSMEGDEKPSLDVLAQVLMATGREHEVPGLWKEQAESVPQDPGVRAKYAMSLLNSGKKDEAMRVFDLALEELEDNAEIKRFYAPVLVAEQDFDRAMDFYEDYLDENPTDVQAMIEYAQTLSQAGRDFEVPPVLKNILASNPDMNTRAQTQAWLIELDQPKRAEAVRLASEKAQAGDHDAAVRELKPLKQWLADYWKMWVVLASALNQTGQHAEAEEAARRTLELFPACEPGYVELNNALAAQEKFEEAYQLMQVAISNMNQSLPIAVSYGLAAKRVGRDEEARQLAQSIREAVGNQPELEQVLEELEK